MNTLYQEQQALLGRQLAVLRRLRDGMRYSAGRLRWPITAADLDDPEAAERLAALNDRFAKQQDQLAGAVRLAHSMLGERCRTYFDVITWITHEDIITDPEVWLELCTLKNQLTHDYDLEIQTAAQYLNALRDNMDPLMAIVGRFADVCQKYRLLPALDGSEYPPMRLSPEQITQIRQSAAESFGPEAHVWLFGSRVDDCKRGGDVDLLVESAIPIGNPAFLAAQLSARPQRKMHGRKVDVLLLAPNLRHLPIHDIARSEGCRL